MKINTFLLIFCFSPGKLGETPEGLCEEVGIHLYASGSTSEVSGCSRDFWERKELSRLWGVVAKVRFPPGLVSLIPQERSNK